MAFIEEPESIDLEKLSASDSDLATNEIALESAALPDWLNNQIIWQRNLHKLPQVEVFVYLSPTKRTRSCGPISTPCRI